MKCLLCDNDAGDCSETKTLCQDCDTKVYHLAGTWNSPAYFKVYDDLIADALVDELIKEKGEDT